MYILCDGYYQLAQVLQKEVIPRSNGVSNKGSIGIGISSNILDIQTRKADNLIEGMNLGYQETRKMTIQTVNGLKNFATNGLTAGNELGGPISVMKTGNVIFLSLLLFY